jgi:hypothetical protein
MRLTSGSTSTLLTLAVAGLVMAQERPDGQRGDRGRGGPPAGGMIMMRASRMMLLRLPEVRKELDLVDEQIAEITKIEEELRAKYPFGGGRGPGGPGGPGGRDGERREGDRGPQRSGASLTPATWYFVQAQDRNQQGQNQPGQGRRPGGFQLSEEDRARLLARAREERTRLAEVLLPEQMKRLTEIYIQVAGIRALQDEDVVKELGINDSQKAKLAEVQRQNEEARDAAMRAMFQGGGGGGDRDANRAKMEEMRTASDAKVLAVLSSDQQKKFDALKGKPFAMPENAFGGGGGGGGPPRGRREGNN